jgi:hypothetical protein
MPKRRAHSRQGRPRISMVCHRRLEVVGGVVSPLSSLQKDDLFRIPRFWISSLVEVIYESSFSLCDSLTSISFESASKLSRIERKAFSGSGLESIHLPASVEVICGYSFAHCKSLSSVNFDADSRLQRIEEFAFAWTGITEMRIPGGLIFISASAFSAGRLKFLSFYPPSPNFRIKGGLLLDISEKQLILCFGDGREFGIVSSVEVICEWCFFEYKWLTSISFDSDSKLSRIANHAFSMSGLKSIAFPASVLEICEYSFCACKSLKSISFARNSKLLRIEKMAFAGSGLKSIDLPRSVEVICECCFYRCKSLASVTFESGSRLQRIEDSAFSFTAINKMTLPRGIGSLSNLAFYGVKLTFV